MERVQQIETLIRQIESSADPGTRAGVRELVEAILEYHGEGLTRILEIVRESGPAGETLVRSLAREPVIGSLLLLYGLHPDDFETRVRRAADTLRGVELISVSDGFIRLRTTSAAISRESVEQVIYSAAPETAGLDIEVPQAAASSFIPIESLLRA
jgi:hypothetical protein